MATQKTIGVVHECDALSGSIEKTVNFTWSGTLDSAQLTGSVGLDFVFHFPLGFIQLLVYVNGILIQTIDAGAGFGPHISQDVNVNVAQWLIQGANNFKFVWQGPSLTAAQTCADVDLIVTAEGSITPPPPVPNPPSASTWIFIAVAAIVGVIVIAVILKVK